MIVHRKGNRAALVGHGRYLAEHIHGARYVELPGDEHLPYVGDSVPAPDSASVPALIVVGPV